MRAFQTSLFRSSKRLFSSGQIQKRKTTQLKEMINSKSLEFIMEAHNGLSAAIVEEAGFKGFFIIIYSFLFEKNII